MKTAALPEKKATEVHKQISRHFRKIAGSMAVALLLMASNCPPVITTSVTVEDIIAALDRNSSIWQKELDRLLKNLDAKEERLRADIQLIASHTIAATGQELRCDGDFLGNRVKEQLKALIGQSNNTISQQCAATILKR